MSLKPIKSAAVVGMGALGMLFGGMLQEHLGESFSFVMDKARSEKYGAQQFVRNGAAVKYNITPVEKAKPADLVIIAVKYPGLASAMDTAAAVIGPDTTIISVMNGISSEKLLAQRFGGERIIDTVAQEMDAMHFGCELRYTKPGRLCVGVPADAGEEKRQHLERLCAFLDAARIAYTIEDDITHRMWSKFMLNVGINQVCMVYGVDYGGATATGSEARMALLAAMREVVLAANAEGIALGEEDIAYYLNIVATLDPKATPSMGQDRLNRRPSEVDAFAGEVIRLGKLHGIPVPANEYIYRRVREIEAAY